MQGLWSNHRRSKLNLNSTITPSFLSAPPVDEVTSSDLPIIQSMPVGEASSSVQVNPNTSSIGNVNTTSAPDGLTSSTPSKRKVRSLRTGEENNSKRAKLSDAPSKDYTPPNMRLADLGGVEACVEKMLELVAMPLCHPEVYLHTGVQPPRGVLLHGPPGCGKTLLANAMAGVSLSYFSSVFFWLIGGSGYCRNLGYRLSVSQHHQSCQVCQANQRRLYEIHSMTPR